MFESGVLVNVYEAVFGEPLNVSGDTKQYRAQLLRLYNDLRLFSPEEFPQPEFFFDIGLNPGRGNIFETFSRYLKWAAEQNRQGTNQAQCKVVAKSLKPLSVGLTSGSDRLITSIFSQPGSLNKVLGPGLVERFLKVWNFLENEITFIEENPQVLMTYIDARNILKRDAAPVWKRIKDCKELRGVPNPEKLSLAPDEFYIAVQYNAVTAAYWKAKKTISGLVGQGTIEAIEWMDDNGGIGNIRGGESGFRLALQALTR